MEYNQKMDTRLLGKESSVYNRYVSTIKNSISTPREKELADECINYIIRQLNEDSMRGSINFTEYQNMVLIAVGGLFSLIYIKYYDDDIVSRDAIFASSYNFLYFLFSRVFMGRDRDLIIKQIESQRPVMIAGSNQGGGQ